MSMEGQHLPTGVDVKVYNPKSNKTWWMKKPVIFRYQHGFFARYVFNMFKKEDQELSWDSVDKIMASY